MKLLVATIAIMAMTARAYAEADFDPDKFKPPTTTTTTGTGTTTTTTTPNTTGTVYNPNANINQGSQQGQSSQSGGSGANAAAGAALMAAGAALMSQPPTVPQGAMLMAMGILAMMQSGHDGDAAGQSGNTGMASVQGNPTKTTNPDPASGSSAFTDAKIAQGKAALEAQGYKMGANGTLTTPDGNTIPPSAFNSPSSMAAAGMSPQAIADAQKIVADAVNDAPKVSSVGVNTSGGGGMAVSEGEGGGEANATGGMAMNPFNLNADAKAKLIAGKTVMFDGEPIGVRGSNIFDMVHDCYQKKRKGNHFIESENDVSVRAPASLRRKKN